MGRRDPLACVGLARRRVEERVVSLAAEFGDDAAPPHTDAIAGFGTRWSRVTLVPTIAGTAGAEVPFAYGAALE